MSVHVDLAERIRDLTTELSAELVEIRRDLHAHPELARLEVRTTALVADRLREAGLEPVLLPGTGLLCDIGPSPVETGRRRVALRADLDALPLTDGCGRPWVSTSPGVAHACGHDVHTTAVLGAGLVLARMAQEGDLPTGVRLLFQPAEEIQPGGALDLLGHGALEGVGMIYAVHCDPRIDVGSIGSRIGPITSASDEVTVTVHGQGGHTSRPHLTGDLVFALGQIITQVPAVLGRRLDPRSGVNLTWGAVQSGSAHNAIPSTGTLKGTLRCLDVHAWERAAVILHETIERVAAGLGVEVEIHHVRGVPPVVNDERAVAHLEAAARAILPADSLVLTEQSLGGEDFAWYLTKVPGALARLGTRTPGDRTYDLHQGDFTVDERAIDVGVRLLAGTALRAARSHLRETADDVPVP